MTNRIAIWLGLIIAAFVALDIALGWGALVFLARKFIDLIQAVAIWR